MNKVKQNIVPELRFPEFKHDGYWIAKFINDLSKTISAGGTPSTTKPEFWAGNIRWMNSGELNLKIVNEVEGRITEEGLKNSSTKIIPENCILIGLAGQGKTRGTVAINRVKLCTNQSIASIYPNTKEFESNYLYHNLDNRYNELRELSAGGEGRGGLNLKIIKAVKIPIPPTLKEQQKISNCLSSIDNLITAETNKLESLKDHKKGLLQQLFPADGETKPQFRFPEFQNDGEWEEKMIEDIAKRYDNLRIPVTASERINGTTPYYGANGIQSYIEGYTHDGEFILVAEDGANDLQNYPVQYANGKIWVNNHAHVLQGNKNLCDNFFLMYIIQNTDIKPYLVGGGRTKLNANIMMKINFLVPKLLEQQKVAKCLSTADNLIEAQTTKIESLKMHKKGLMQQLFPNLNESTE